MNHSTSRQNKLKEAQQRHSQALFAGDPPATAPAQQAADQAKQRATDLEQAAHNKRRSLSDEEQQKLSELTARQARPGASNSARSTPAAPEQSADPIATPATASANPAPAPARSAPAHSELHQLSQRNDLASAALRNMRIHARERRAQSAPLPTSQPTDQAARQSTDQPAPAGKPTDQPVDTAPSTPPPTRRSAPSPEELDRLLRAMASRASRPGGAPPAGARPSRPERGEAAPGSERAEDLENAPEAPPEAPEEAPERRAEKQAEILKELQSRESAAQLAAKPVPQADDQTVAKEAAVEARVPIETVGNAVRSDPLHAEIVRLQQEMKAHNAGGQVAGVNQVQENMPNHPLWKGGRRG